MAAQGYLRRITLATILEGTVYVLLELGGPSLALSPPLSDLPHHFAETAQLLVYFAHKTSQGAFDIAKFCN